jgi:AraC-like DNA-binding protein
MAARITLLDGMAVEPTTTGPLESVLAFAHLSVHRFRQRSNKLSHFTFEVPAREHALIATLRGVLVLCSDTGEFDMVVPENSYCYLRGPVTITVNASRGDKEHLFITWEKRETLALSRWIDEAVSYHGSLPNESLAVCKPMGQGRHRLTERLLRLIAKPTDATEPALLALIHDIVARVIAPANGTGVPLPTDVPESVRNLLAEVNADPQRPWSLEKAAEQAGYSTFHFSRLFKSLFGYGFRDYVHKLRCALAAEELLIASSPVDEVARKSGFHSVRALRTAMKEHIGILPSEVRRLGQHESGG